MLNKLLGIVVNSWDRQKIIEKVTWAADEWGSSNPQQQKQLIFACKNALESEAFFGLFSFFYDSALQENNFQRQQLAGQILLAVAPGSKVELEGSVYAAAQHWNLSIEELPWYWCKVFGKNAVIEFLSEVIPSCAEQELKRSIETMHFWAKEYGQANT